MEKRLLIALGMSILVLVAFQGLTKKSAVQTVVQPAVESAQMPAGPIAQTPTVPAAVAPAKGQMLQETETVMQTEKFDLVFSDIGGTLKKLSLREYAAEEQEEVLLLEDTPEYRLFAMQSNTAPGIANNRYETTKGRDFLEYRFTKPGWIEVVKRYNLHNNFDYIDLSVSIKNLSPNPMVLSYQMTGPTELLQTSKVMGRSFLEADVMIDGEVWRTRSAKGAKERAGNISWLGIKNRYFAVLLKPSRAPKTVVVQPMPKKNFLTAMTSSVYQLAPGESTEDTFLMYAGPISEKRLADMGYGFEKISDYGIFGGVSKVLLTVLRFFYGVVKNWGVAIILLTIAVNLILFPLTIKSIISMQQMKKVQPHVQKLKDLHKDNPQKLNKEMMELYRQYKVNPLGGCLPLLLQMPIFIALYQGLIRSVELKGAHFLWIKDLARPDAVPLPFSLPFIGASINILPLLMVVFMVLQQKISQGAAAMTAEQASQQKMMMVMFPLVFGFLFYKMPSGLVLYWLTNTVLMTTEHFFIGKRMAHT